MNLKFSMKNFINKSKIKGEKSQNRQDSEITLKLTNDTGPKLQREKNN